MTRGRTRRRTRDRTYAIDTSPSMRWAGIKGRRAFVDITSDDAPQVAIRGDKRGRIAFPVSDIERLRIGVEFGRWTHYRAVLRRRGGRSMLLDGTHAMADYRLLVLRLVGEMEAIGHLDRVERGLRLWENLVHLLIFGGICLMLCYAPYDTWMRWGADWTRGEQLFAAGLFAVALVLLGMVLWTWFRWYRPRPLRDIADVERLLPKVDADDYMP